MPEASQAPRRQSTTPADIPAWAWLSLAASMALVGSYVGLSKLLLAVFPVFLLAWMRFAIAALAMAGWLVRAPNEPVMAVGDRRWLFLQSFLGNFGFSICMLYGVGATSATAAGIVMAAMPAAVALLARIFLREPITPRITASIGLAAAGIAWLALARDPWGTDPGPAHSAPWWGYALLVGAVFCEASYVVIGKRLSATVSPRRVSALINLWGLALITPFGLWQAWTFDFRAVPMPTWGLTVFYAIAASVVTVWLWMHGLRHVPAARAGVVTVCLPLTAAIVGVFLLSEPFGLSHAMAMALAMAGLLLATWPQRVPKTMGPGS